MVKWVLIAIMALIAVLDILLILGCGKLERMREERDDEQHR